MVRKISILILMHLLNEFVKNRFFKSGYSKIYSDKNRFYEKLFYILKNLIKLIFSQDVKARVKVK